LSKSTALTLAYANRCFICSTQRLGTKIVMITDWLEFRI